VGAGDAGELEVEDRVPPSEIFGTTNRQPLQHRRNELDENICECKILLNLVFTAVYIIIFKSAGAFAARGRDPGPCWGTISM
jgi:hypothetical protein